MTEPTLADAGFTPTRDWFVSPDHAALLAATLDADPRVLDGGVLPLPWHWACFLPGAPTSALGADGHPRRRAEMAGFPNRMWVGGRVRSLGALRLGAGATRTSRLLRAEEKDGSTGRFWLLAVGHSISQGGVPCIEEEQDLVLRELSPAAAAGTDMPPPASAWIEEVNVDPPLLFRYSALTFNAHRIHYDAPYAVGVEGYPDLVVQGPLTATLLSELARRSTGRPVTAIRFRARAPLFANHHFWLSGEPRDAGAALSAVRADGVTAMTLDAELATDPT